MNFDLNAQSLPQRRPHRRPAPAQPLAAPQSRAPQKHNPKKQVPNPSAPRPLTASVPISVYRELSAELQATQAMLDSLHGQNQHLQKQNIHLQQEVASIVQAAQKMQHRAGGPNPGIADIQQSGREASGQSCFAPNASMNVPAVPQGYAAQSSIEVPPQLRRGVQGGFPAGSPAMPPRVSEPPRPQEMPIMPDGVDPLRVQRRSPLAGESQGAMPGQPRHPNSLQGESQSQSQSASPFSPSRRQAAVETLNKIFTGREQPLPRRALDEESSDEIHTGWLVLIVLVIVVTAFGTGFMVVRPFLSPNR